MGIRVIPRKAILIAFLAVGSLCSIFSQAQRKVPLVPMFTELSPTDSARLDRQRGVILAVAKQHYGTVALTKTKKDLPVLQKLIDDKAFSQSQTYELQCLGVAFGDVLASELPLRWVIITDEFGTDPTLRFKDTDLNINALTMLSKRVERGETVNVSELLRITREHLADYEKGTL
jgi:hypothetical protein